MFGVSSVTEVGIMLGVRSDMFFFFFHFKCYSVNKCNPTHYSGGQKQNLKMDSLIAKSEQCHIQNCVVTSYHES